MTLQNVDMTRIKYLLKKKLKNWSYTDAISDK